MTETTVNKTFMGAFTRVREYLKEESALFGLLRWEKVVGIESLGDEQLRIFTDKIPPKVFINGQEYSPTNH